MKVFSYDKKEKLKSRKQLQQIFTLGKSFTVFPVKVFFQFDDGLDVTIKAGVGVSKKHFKKAVDRNYVKRLLREVYRTEKIYLHEQLKTINKKLKVFFLFIDGTLPAHNLLQQKMRMIIEKLGNEANNLNEANS